MAGHFQFLNSKSLHSKLSPLLFIQFLNKARPRTYCQVSLSFGSHQAAINFYQKLHFDNVGVFRTLWVMTRKLNQSLAIQIA
jgi:hypothetical protein